jgi:LysR family transcriptional activator of glutamate synthase operon
MLFSAIVEQKSFSRAAEIMYISQSSLSKQIKAIENELGVALFFRDNHQIELTEAGKTFLPYAVKFIKDYSDMTYNLSFFNNNHKSIFTVRIGAIPVLSYSGLISQLTNLQLNNPNIYIDFVEREQSELLKMLDHNQIDFAIALIDHLPPDYYEYLPLISEDLGVLCSRKYHLASKKILSLRDLKNESFVLLNSTSGLYKFFIDAFHNVGYTPKINYVSSRHEILLAMVSSSNNLTLLPQNLPDLSYNRKIKYIPLKEHISGTIALVHKKKTKSNRKLTYFKTIVKEYFSK